MGKFWRNCLEIWLTFLGNASAAVKTTWQQLKRGTITPSRGGARDPRYERCLSRQHFAAGNNAPSCFDSRVVRLSSPAFVEKYKTVGRRGLYKAFFSNRLPLDKKNLQGVKLAGYLEIYCRFQMECLFSGQRGFSGPFKAVEVF